MTELPAAKRASVIAACPCQAARWRQEFRNACGTETNTPRLYTLDYTIDSKNIQNIYTDIYPEVDGNVRSGLAIHFLERRLVIYKSLHGLKVSVVNSRQQRLPKRLQRHSSRGIIFVESSCLAYFLAMHEASISYSIYQWRARMAARGGPRVHRFKPADSARDIERSRGPTTEHRAGGRGRPTSIVLHLQHYRWCLDGDPEQSISSSAAGGCVLA